MKAKKVKKEPEMVYKICAGPGLKYRDEDCPITFLHRVVDCNDVKSYNGIINWRCPACFKEHRKRVRQK